jgi:hypothetical protein
MHIRSKSFNILTLLFILTIVVSGCGSSSKVKDTMKHPMLVTNRNTIYIYNSVDCPYSTEFANTMRKIEASNYKDLALMMVIKKTDDALFRSTEFIKMNRLTKWIIILDEDESFAKSNNILTIPTAMIVNAKNELIFKGAIDDRYETPSTKRETVVKTFLLDAIENFQAGKSVKNPKYIAIGCDM